MLKVHKSELECVSLLLELKALNWKKIWLVSKTKICWNGPNRDVTETQRATGAVRKFLKKMTDNFITTR